MKIIEDTLRRSLIEKKETKENHQERSNRKRQESALTFSIIDLFSPSCNSIVSNSSRPLNRSAEDSVLQGQPRPKVNIFTNSTHSALNKQVLWVSSPRKLINFSLGNVISCVFRRGHVQEINTKENAAKGQGRVCLWNNKTIKKHKDTATIAKKVISRHLSQISAVRTGVCAYMDATLLTMKPGL